MLSIISFKKKQTMFQVFALEKKIQLHQNILNNKADAKDEYNIWIE